MLINTIESIIIVMMIRLEDMNMRCNQEEQLSDRQIKGMLMGLIEQMKDLKVVNNNNNIQIQQGDVKMEGLRQQYEGIRMSMIQLQKSINKNNIEMKKITVIQIQKIQNDMKLLLSQFEVEYGIWDQMYFLFLNRFQKQINEQFLKVYSMIQQNRNFEQKCKIFPENLEFTEPAELFFAERTMQFYEKERQKDRKANECENKLKSSLKVQKILKKRLKRELKYFPEQIEILKQEYKYSRNWVNSKCYNLSNIIFEDNQIIVTNNVMNVFLFGFKIVENQFVFCLRFDNISQNVSLGIGDVEYVSLSKIGEFERNIIQYTNDAYLYADGKYVKKEGQGFKIREKIVVSGNLKLRKIRFLVENQVRCSYEWQKNMYKNVKWVPYLVINNQDAVSILELRK